MRREQEEVRQLEESVRTKKSHRAFERLLKGFHLAAHVTDDITKAKSKKPSAAVTPSDRDEKARDTRLVDSKLQRRLVMFCLKHANDVLRHHLHIDGDGRPLKSQDAAPASAEEKKASAKSQPKGKGKKGEDAAAAAAAPESAAAEEKDETKSGSLKLLPRWKVTSPLLKSFLGNAVHFLNSQTEVSTLR